MLIYILGEETIGDLEYEIDKEKFFGRGNFSLPKLVETSAPFTNKCRLTVDPIVAIKRTIKIKPGEKKMIHLIVTANEDREKVLERVEKYRNEENIKRTFKLSRARVEAENRYLGLKGKQIDVFQKMLSYLIYKHPISKTKIMPYKNEKFEAQGLWKYGISGDLPILLVKISNINDIQVLEECVKAYEYYRTKNIEIDLVILNEEESSYENYVKDGIERVLFNHNIMFMQNQKAGIFILNNLEENEKRFFHVRANLVLDCHLGNIKLQMQDLEDEYLEKMKGAVYEQEKPLVIEDVQNQTENINMQELKYYNEYGGFSRRWKRVFN